MLSNSATSFKQWKDLAPMTWLKRLDLKQCPIDGEAIRWVLDTFPELEHFALTPGYVDANTMMYGGDLSLELIDRPNLQKLDLGGMGGDFWTSVRIINSPNVTVALRLGYVQQLEVIDAPSVTGISVESPLPDQTRLGGLRDLGFFAVGGPAVSDDVIAAMAARKPPAKK